VDANECVHERVASLRAPGLAGLVLAEWPDPERGPSPSARDKIPRLWLGINSGHAVLWDGPIGLGRNRLVRAAWPEWTRRRADPHQWCLLRLGWRRGRSEVARCFVSVVVFRSCLPLLNRHRRFGILTLVSLRDGAGQWLRVQAPQSGLAFVRPMLPGCRLSRLSLLYLIDTADLKYLPSCRSETASRFSRGSEGR
jgi:hypothetical protein